jgi:hypothetical protein
MWKQMRRIAQKNRRHIVKGWVLVTLASGFLPLSVRAQSSDTGPLTTASGALQFAHQGREVVVTLDDGRFDHFPAGRLTHFDDLGTKDEVVQRMLVDTDAGPVLYDFRRRPPVVQAISLRMTVRRVFWQGEEVILQGSKGWYRYEHGALTKLQSTKTTFH